MKRGSYSAEALSSDLQWTPQCIPQERLSMNAVKGGPADEAACAFTCRPVPCLASVTREAASDYCHTECGG
ncbi:unnamed protein product [Lampetra fluviatilis]